MSSFDIFLYERKDGGKKENHLTLFFHILFSIKKKVEPMYANTFKGWAE